jgi:hypothetical protein
MKRNIIKQLKKNEVQIHTSTQVNLGNILLPERNQLQEYILARHWWLIPVILATQDAEIRRITVQSQPGQIVPGNLS